MAGTVAIVLATGGKVENAFWPFSTIQAADAVDDAAIRLTAISAFFI